VGLDTAQAHSDHSLSKRQRKNFCQTKSKHSSDRIQISDRARAVGAEMTRRGKQTADTTEKEPYENPDAEGSNNTARQSGNQKAAGSVLPWMMTLAVAVLCAVAGLTLGRLFAAYRTPDRTEHCSENLLLDLGATEKTPSSTESEQTWYYDLDPVTVNLNEPSFRHHIRASVTLEMCRELDPLKGRAFLEQNKVLLTNRFTLYLSGLARQDLRGEGKIEQVQLQIRDIFNEKLFPPSRPHIKRVLIKHLAME
jgi:flagellar basal body-associated protein FliL